MIRNYLVSDGLSEEETTKILKELKLGYINLSEEMFDLAEINFSLAIQYDSKCAEAYWGKMLSKFRIKNEDDLVTNYQAYKDILILKECEKALEFANETQKKIYERLLKNIRQLNQKTSVETSNKK